MDLFTTITFIISESADLSDMLPLLVWLIFARKKSDYAILGVFLITSATLKLLALVSAKMGIHNMPVFHLLAMTEVVIVYCYYSRLLFRKIYVWGAVGLIVLNLGNSLFIQHPDTFNSIAWTVDMLVLIVLGIMHLSSLYNNESDQSPLEQRPQFIITAGFLIYASGSLFTYLMGPSIFSGKAAGFFHNAWVIQCLATIFRNMLISYGLWRAR